MLTLYRMKHSTNVERVELALAHKKLEARSVWVDPNDRGEVRRVSGQDLVPVLQDEAHVVIDSMEIVRYLEERYPGRSPLYPAEPSARAQVLLFIDWFNRVWKRPPNDLDTELSKPARERDAARVDKLGSAMAGYLDWFEQLLTGRENLFGEFGAADIAAFPFVKYASHPLAPDDREQFHAILRDYQKPGKTHPNVLAWIARVDRKPRLA
jgi:glutathione S-transferase